MLSRLSAHSYKRVSLTHRLLYAATLELQDNMLSGQAPSALFALPSLQVLRVDGNPFSGRIPTSMSELQALKELRLGQSHMGGPLPDDIYALPYLEILDLNNANFTGALSSSIGSLNDTLKELLLYNNTFSGPIPQELSLFGKLGTCCVV